MANHSVRCQYPTSIHRLNLNPTSWKWATFPKAKLFVKSYTHLVRQGDSADHYVNAAGLKDCEEVGVQGRADPRPSPSGAR